MPTRPDFASAITALRRQVPSPRQRCYAPLGDNYVRQAEWRRCHRLTAALLVDPRNARLAGSRSSTSTPAHAGAASRAGRAALDPVALATTSWRRRRRLGQADGRSARWASQRLQSGPRRGERN
jgi:hypothetical protein